MPSERPLLTIAIPTYNRSGYLAHLLGALAPQLPGQPDVELIISDNASPDDTPALIQRFREQGLRCTYIRNGSNVGPDANFLQCFERANGKYVWIVGDDDVVVSDAIEKIVRYLSGPEYDLVYMKPYENRHPPRMRRPLFKKASDVYTPEEFARRVHIFFTFISGNIINKDRVLSAPHPPFSALIGTNLIQLGWIYTALNEHRRSLFIHEPLVGGTENNSGGYGLCAVFGSNLAHITDKWLKSERVKRPIINGTLQRFFPTYLLSAKKGSAAFEQENPHRILRPAFGANLRYWLFNFPVIMMPSPLARCWVFVGRWVNNMDKALGNPLMR